MIRGSHQNGRPVSLLARLTVGAGLALWAAVGGIGRASAQCANYLVTQGTGTIIPGEEDTGNHIDDGTTLISLPFSWSLYGVSYDSAYVCSNGNLQFVSTGTFPQAYTNDCLPSTAQVTGATIFPHWDDLRTDTTYPGAGIYVSTNGVAPNRNFAIEWRAVYYANTGQTANFEVVLYEGQTRFDVIYGQVDGGGASATVGVQAGSAGPFTQFECNSGGISQGVKLTIDCPTTYPPSCQLAASPNSGPEGSTFTVTSMVSPGGGPPSVTLSATLDASSMGLGTVTLYDDGSHGDQAAGDHVFTNQLTVAAGTAAGQYTLTGTATDDQNRSSTCTTHFQVSGANDDCGGAIPAVLGDNSFDNSAATTSSPAATCGLLGNDLWYTFSTPTQGDLTITTCGLTTSDSAVAIYSDCNTAIACDDDSACGLQSTLTICAQPNTTYYLRIGGFNGARWTGSFNLSLDTNTHPPYGAPADSVAEGEPCSFDLNNDTVDGGCNSTPPVYATLNYCTDYSGTCENGWVDPATGFSYRDTDWYQFTVESFDNLTISGQCQFAGYLWIIQEPCPGTVMGGFPVAIGPTTGGCSPSVDFSTTTSLGAGTYDLAIMPQSFYGDVQCGTNEQYWFRVQTDAGCGPVCGSADFNCDGDVGTDSDILSFFACLAGNCPPAPCTSTADFDGDGSVGTDNDITAFFRVLAGGNC